MTDRVMIVEDDPRIRVSMKALLEEHGYQVDDAKSAEEFLNRQGSGFSDIDLLVLDVRLPGLSGVDLVRRLGETGNLPQTVMVSGEATVAEAVEALHQGIYDFLEKPFSNERLLRTVRNALDASGLQREVEELRHRINQKSLILGESDAIVRLRQIIERSSGFDCAVLILGESGTGKELVADAVHRAGPRGKGPLVKVNCAALPPTLIEDVLFGHIRGAFTDAASARRGVFEEAHGGSLFLDEIGDMDPGLQARLLRVLEDGVVRRLGDDRDRQVDVRIIAATNQDLEGRLGDSSFREDLYYRLAHLVIEVPPLRDRGDDIMLLFSHFLAEACARSDSAPRRLDPAAERLLLEHPWPGNVRELRNLVERLVILAGDPIGPEDLPPRFRALGQAPAGFDDAHGSVGAAPTLRDYRLRCEAAYIRRVLALNQWNFTQAARVLGVQRTYLHRKAAALGIVRPTG